MNSVFVKKLKGGSLSSTVLMRKKTGEYFVRKSISRTDEREYGFQRWYSQLKKLQRFSVMFPGLFPNVMGYGIDGDSAYFDINFIENSVNAQEFIYKSESTKDIDIFFSTLVDAMNSMHKLKIKSNPHTSIDLYISEEVERRMLDCISDTSIRSFFELDYIIFNGRKVKSFMNRIGEYKRILKECYVYPYEVFTHGNITLENLLYNPVDKSLIFIDPYEENIIDSELAEFSQLLQSSNSKYEIYNAQSVSVHNNKVEANIDTSFGMEYFNQKLNDYLKHRYERKEYFAIRLLEVSQFIRMLPFKASVDKSKVYLFYGLASQLFEEIVNEYYSNKGLATHV